MQELTTETERVAASCGVSLTACGPKEAGIDVENIPGGWVEDVNHRIVAAPTVIYVDPYPTRDGEQGDPFSSNAVLVAYRLDGPRCVDEVPSLVEALSRDATHVPGWSAIDSDNPYDTGANLILRTGGTIESPYGSLHVRVDTGGRASELTGYLFQLTVTSLESQRTSTEGILLSI